MVVGLKIFYKARSILTIGWALFFWLFSCGPRSEQAVPESLIKSVDEHHVTMQSGSLSSRPRIKVADQDSQTVLGNWVEEKDELKFLPIVAFTPGLTYEILIGDKVLDTFEIPDNVADSPHLVNFYPASDTVPENLLKVYLEFSFPHRFGTLLSVAHIDFAPFRPLRAMCLGVWRDRWLWV